MKRSWIITGLLGAIALGVAGCRDLDGEVRISSDPADPRTYDEPWDGDVDRIRWERERWDREMKERGDERPEK